MKASARLVLGRRWAHAQDWLPGLELTRPSSGVDGAIVYRGKPVGGLRPAAALRAGPHGVIHIVGSGPSVRDTAVERLERGSAILLNGAISLVGSGIEEPLAVAIEDERFVWRHFDLMRAKIAVDTPCLLSTMAIRAICERDEGWLAGRPVILVDNILKPYRHARREMKEVAAFDFVVLADDGSAGFSLDPDRGVFQGGTVAISALQFAFVCAPRRIGLVGIDISNSKQPRFYEAGGNAAFSGLAVAEERILAHFSLARRIAAERGIEIANYSAVSVLAKCGIAYDAGLARRPDAER